jgi:hypothetical protein
MLGVMTTLPVDEVLAEAREVQFSKVALVVILWPFWAFGWLVGHMWLALAFFGVSIRRGWRDSTDWDAKQELPVLLCMRDRC